jgi:hypothetical protein
MAKDGGDYDASAIIAKCPDLPAFTAYFGGRDAAISRKRWGGWTSAGRMKR